MVNAQDILKMKKCGDLFSNDKVKIKIEFRNYAKFYHPDSNKNPLASEAFKKINELYHQGLELLEKNEWEISNIITIISDSKQKVNYRFLSEKDFELGKIYICNNNLIYLLDSKNERYYKNFLKQIIKIKYKNQEMEKEFSRFMPQLSKNFKTNKGEYCLILSKTDDVYLLADLLEFYKGKINDKHVAWIMSRLSNLCCYLQHIGVVHNGLSINNCFVSPKFHGILLLGGWWYATDIGEKMIGTQKDIFDVMSVKDKSEKISNVITDLESTKSIGRKLLNNNIKSLNDFKKETHIPKPFLDFLFSGSSSNSIDEFKKWNKALDKSYGERKFIKMEVSNNDIYK